MLLFVSTLACAHPALLPPKAIDLNREGAIALAAGDLEKAEARIALALEYNARFTEAWVNLGLVEMNRGNFERAHRDFVKARDLNPDLPAPHQALGLLAERQGRGPDAERHYRAALKVDPGFAPARINLSRLLFARGALEEAREQFLRVTEVAPEFVEGWTGLSESLMRLQRLREAWGVLVRARERFGPHPALALLEARVSLHEGAFAQAVEQLEPLARLPDRQLSSAACSWLAIARLGTGDTRGAAQAAELAISIDPDDEVARYALQMAGGRLQR
jgi:tetratricopeptide (TPR) repeat protein